MKTKKVLTKAGSGILAIPQFSLAGTGMVLGGVETVIRTVADGVGYLKDKSFEGEAYFENMRTSMTAETKALEAEVKATLGARRRKATA